MRVIVTCWRKFIKKYAKDSELLLQWFRDSMAKWLPDASKQLFLQKTVIYGIENVKKETDNLYNLFDDFKSKEFLGPRQVLTDMANHYITEINLQFSVISSIITAQSDHIIKEYTAMRDKLNDIFKQNTLANWMPPAGSIVAQISLSPWRSWHYSKMQMTLKDKKYHRTLCEKVVANILGEPAVVNLHDAVVCQIQNWQREIPPMERVQPYLDYIKSLEPTGLSEFRRAVW
jgi:hypothetical protein